MLHFLRSLDSTFFHLLNQIAGRSTFFDELMLFTADSYMVSGILLMSIIWYLWFKRSSETREQVIREFIGASLAGPISRGLQHVLPFHSRPIHDPLSGIHLAIGINPNALNHWSSFPSDHASVFIALAAVVFIHSRRLGAFACFWAILVSLPRVVLGYHWPADILGGALIGVITVWLGRIIVPRRFAAGILSFERTSPAYFYSIAFFASYQVATLYTELRQLAGILRSGV